MKSKFLFLFGFILLSLTISAQGDVTVTKFNGETFTCDYVSPGRTIVFKTKGKDKIKLPYNEVRYYTIKYKMNVKIEKEKMHQVDTTRKCFVPADGREYTYQIENDSVHLATVEKTINDMTFIDYYIFDKNNVEVVKIEKTMQAIVDLKKYFGGSCAEFDKRIVEYTPKFKKVSFPYSEWDTLLYLYATKCMPR